VLITIYATFEPLTCTATSAILGSAGPNAIGRTSVQSALPRTDRWYPGAMVNRFLFEDFDPDDFADISTFDMRARFNSQLGQPGPCQAFSDWYYGLDNQHGAQTDLFTVLLHEFAHGLGFTYFEDRTTFDFVGGSPSIWGDFLLDNTTNKHWSEMTSAERLASSTNDQHLVWDGPLTTGQVPATLGGPPLLRITAPNSLARDILEVGTAAFGPPLTEAGVSGDLQVGSSLACNGMPLDPFQGRIAVIDAAPALRGEGAQRPERRGQRGGHRQQRGGVIGMSGSDPTIAIPPDDLPGQRDAAQGRHRHGDGGQRSAPPRPQPGAGRRRRSEPDRHYVPATFAPAPPSPTSTSAPPQPPDGAGDQRDLTHGLDLTIPSSRTSGGSWWIWSSIRPDRPPRCRAGR
jgi:hypothetical protein